MYTNKNLTVMFTDICGFTQQAGSMSRSELMQSLATHNALLIPIIQKFGGSIVKSIGDAFLITFESPTDALHCGLCLQHALRVHNRELDGQHIHIKVSVNCGEVALTEDDVFGDPVNVAAKIEKVTEPDQVYFTESVFLAMKQAEVPCEFVTRFAVKGDAAPEVKLYRLLLDEGNAEYQRIVRSCAERATTDAPARIKATQAMAPRLPWAQALTSRKAVGLYAFLAIAVFGAGVWQAQQLGLKAISVTPNPPLPSQGPNLSSVPPNAVPAQTIAPESNVAAPEASAQKTEPAQPSSRPTEIANSKSAAVLVWADVILQDPAQRKEQSNTVIEKLALEFGNNTEDKRVQAALLSALKSRVYWEARNASFEEAGVLLKAYRIRFLWVEDWSLMERERYLGGFHNYVGDNKLRRDWLSVWNERFQNHYAFLKSAADQDPDFGLRFAIEFNEINQRRNKIAAPQEQILVREAIARKPELLRTERAALLALVQSWLQSEQAEDSYARELTRQHLYADLKPWLVKNLMANHAGLPARPAYEWRQNCFALLASKNDLEVIADVSAYIKNNPHVFLRVSETKQLADGTSQTDVFVRREYIQRFLQRPFNDDERTALAQWLDGLQQEMSAGVGPWANHESSRLIVLSMQEAISTAKPAL